jgi:hypothetical protein
MLARASIYAQGLYGIPAGTVVSPDAPVVRTFIARAGGQDLRSDQLFAFYHAAAVRARRDGRYALTSAERRMRALVQRLAHYYGGRSFVLLTFGLTYEPTVVVGHELLHAQYFMEPGYRAAVEAYWCKLPWWQRSAVRRVLSPTYQKTNDALIKNEFQAYLLQRAAERATLADFVPAHRHRLRKHLRDAGHPPVRVDAPGGLRERSNGRAVVALGEAGGA